MKQASKVLELMCPANNDMPWEVVSSKYGVNCPHQIHVCDIDMKHDMFKPRFHLAGLHYLLKIF